MHSIKFHKTIKMSAVNIVIHLLLFTSQIMAGIGAKPEPFKIRLERIDSVYTNVKYVNWTMWTTHYNRTDLAANGIFYTPNELPKNAKIRAKVFEFVNNEYRPFIIDFELPVCSILQNQYKKLIYKDVSRDNANMFPPTCPLKKGNYTFFNLVPEGANYPIALPIKRLRLDISARIDSEPLAKVQIYASLDKDAYFRNKKY